MSTSLLLIFIGASGGLLGNTIGYSVSSFIIKKHNPKRSRFLLKAGIICSILSTISALGAVGVVSTLSVDDPVRETLVSMIVGSLTVAIFLLQCHYYSP